MSDNLQNKPASEAEVKKEISMISTVLNFLGTRADMIGLEGKDAGKNVVALAVYGVLALVCTILFLVFVSVALLVIYWDQHRVFISCGLAVFYLVVGLFFFGKVKSRKDALPYSFTLSRQVIGEDVKNLRAVMEGKKPTDYEDPVTDMNQQARPQPEAKTAEPQKPAQEPTK